MIVIFSREEVADSVGLKQDDVDDYLLLKFAEVGFTPFKQSFPMSTILMVMDSDIFMDPEDVRMNAMDALIRDMGRHHSRFGTYIDVKQDTSNSDRIYLEIYQ